MIRAIAPGQLAAAAALIILGAAALAPMVAVAERILAPEDKHTRALDAQLANYARLAAQRPALQALLREEAAAQTGALLYAATAAPLAAADAQSRITQLIERLGAQTASVNAEPGAAAAHGGAFALTVAFEATHEALARILHALETEPPVHVVQTLAVVDPDSASPVPEEVNRLHVEVRLQAYWAAP